MSLNNTDDLFLSTDPSARPMEVIVRFTAVKRWHMIDTAKAQSVAEHSAAVALLAFYIARTCPRVYFGAAVAVATYGLIHDLAEAVTGDIPTITKRHLSGTKELEYMVLPNFVNFGEVPPDHVMELIKLCDLADGIRFIQIHGIGQTARWAAAGLEDQMAKLISKLASKWPVVVLDHVTTQLRAYIKP